MIKNYKICKKYNENLQDINNIFNAYYYDLTNKELIEEALEGQVRAEELFTESGYDEEAFINISDFFNNLQKAMVFEKCKEMKSAFRRLYWVYISMIIPIVAESEEQIPDCLKHETILMKY